MKVRVGVPFKNWIFARSLEREYAQTATHAFTTYINSRKILSSNRKCSSFWSFFKKHQKFSKNLVHEYCSNIIFSLLSYCLKSRLLIWADPQQDSIFLTWSQADSVQNNFLVTAGLLNWNRQRNFHALDFEKTCLLSGRRMRLRNLI